MNHRPRLVGILGPTGIGKTEIAVKLAREYGGEIISADSMQVYRYMDIGTAKPTPEEQSLVRHHLIDLVNPDEEFDAVMFVERARRVIDRLISDGKNIFVVGGTGLYIDALIGGLFDGPGADRNLRSSYREDMEKYGRGYLYKKLKERDEAAAERIHPNDVSRIIRALEVLELSGESIVKKQDEHNFGDKIYDSVKIGLMMDRDRLYERINERVEKMVADGLVREVEKLIGMGYDETLKPMQSFGYKHIVNCIKGMHDISEAVMLIKRDTRHYAKRQLTWFRADKDIEWFAPSDIDGVRAKIESFLI
ncbi:MAG: tRNA (adenosine(37)-N6)-dimethylallyltransferase MiaA [Proteobacteria bacterium]|nr:tRNA (adenosine(37)-N6)-dimethylallyltransferase MiaA [Pseudomonadota bacterium]